MIKKSIRREIHIGTSGFSYNHWKENFYPSDLQNKHWLTFYSGVFSTVELNTTFYRLPLGSTVKNWYSQVPEHFVFSIKASRYLTHQKKLNDPEESLKIFYQRMEFFKSKLGPILFQLPPAFKKNKERFEKFLTYLNVQYRHVFEFRHDSWFDDEIYDIMKKHNIALCITDLNGSLSPEAITSDFTYIRLHGPKKAYQGSYGSKLKEWKNKIAGLASEISVFCYFDNDEKGYAVQDAKTLQELFFSDRMNF